jgi:pilus assembly protein CpaF
MSGTVQGHEVVAAVHAEVLDLLDGGDGTGLASAVEAAVARREPLLGPVARGSLVQAVLSRISGMGSLEALFADGSVTEVMVNGPGIVFVERHGRLEATDVRIDAVELDRLVERMVAPTGRRVDRSSPWADGRLPDGSRVNVVVQPIALDGPYLTVRRFGERRFTIEDFSEPPVAEVLHRAVSDR